MSYQISTSVVKLDLDYILDNFFKPSLWKKTWTVFAWDKYEIKINLSSIYPKTQSVYFEIVLYCKGEEVKSTNVSFNYDKGNRNLVAIMNNFNGTIVRMIEDYEERLIKKTWAYRQAEQVNSVRADAYRQAAEEKLEELKALDVPVIQQFINEISEMYIEEQVSKAYDFTTQNNIIAWNKGKILKPLFLSYMLFAEMDERRERFIKESNFYAKPTSKMIGKILSELSRVKKLDFIDTIKDNLDEIKL